MGYVPSAVPVRLCSCFCIWFQYFSVRMDSRHDYLNLSDLHTEQLTIDGIIDDLLNFTPAIVINNDVQQKRKSVENINASASSAGTSTNSPAQVKKSRGRPPKVTVPPVSPLLPTSNQKPSLDSIIDCLKRLSDQNKRLFNIIGVLAEKVKQNDSVEGAAVSQNEEPPKAALDDVTDRLDKIEKNLNSNILICRGPAVESLIARNTSGTTEPNLERLKGEVCRAICGEEAIGVDVCNLQLTLFGRNKKSLKFDCRNRTSKVHLLKQARAKRPQGIFVSEYLTSTNLNIFYNLRQLRKQHPGKIKSAFTKGGNVFYCLHNSNQVVQVNTIRDLPRLTASENVGITEGGE